MTLAIRLMTFAAFAVSIALSLGAGWFGDQHGSTRYLVYAVLFAVFMQGQTS